MMKKLIAIGEALIDFIPMQSGVAMKDVKEFQPAVGGAPANVCGAYVKLGGDAALITQLGTDSFGTKIVDEFEADGIDCSYIKRTNKANTSLAFVALKEDGDREFNFFRNPGADMLLGPESIESSWFTDTFALHFCSVSLGDFPMKEAHRQAIRYAKEAGSIISFDSNLRPALWSDVNDMRKAVLEFLPYDNVVKISDEELEFITGTTDVEEAMKSLLSGDVKLVIYTKGGDGAEAYTASTKAVIPGRPLKAVDTTGAGDGFIGSFLYQLSERGIDCDKLTQLTSEELVELLTFSNKYCAMSVMKKGAIASYATREEMQM